MDLYSKISILGPDAQYDTCGPRDFGLTTNIPGVYHAKVNGHTCRLFKVLQTNSCKNNCRYCAFRAGRDCPRTTATPDEMASAFISAHRRRLVEGLFLSSGIAAHPDSTMTRMLETVDILRRRDHYRGYIHLKIMPGSSSSVIRQAIKTCNRLSLNIESPTQAGLSLLSPDKSLKTGFFDTLFEIRKQLRQIKNYGLKTPSLTTQFVVGASQESDSDFIKTTHLLYQNFNFKRVFFSAFRPIPQTPLEHLPPASLVRQHRLYQSDFLMRFYRFSPADLPLDSAGNLSETTDPKTLWANAHPKFFPVNLNSSSYWNLLKVPGLGPVLARRIIDARLQSHLNFLHLAYLGLPRKAVPYLSF